MRLSLLLRARDKIINSALKLLSQNANLLQIKTDNKCKKLCKASIMSDIKIYDFE